MKHNGGFWFGVAVTAVIILTPCMAASADAADRALEAKAVAPWPGSFQMAKDPEPVSPRPTTAGANATALAECEAKLGRTEDALDVAVRAAKACGKADQQAPSAGASEPSGKSNDKAPLAGLAPVVGPFAVSTTSKSIPDVLSLLILSGLMGMVGQGVRTIVGLKKLADLSNSSAPSEADTFAASRIFIGLMIGFVAGVAGGLTSRVFEAKAMTGDLLFYLASIGYIGVDVIEAFAQTLTAGRKPPSEPSDDKLSTGATPKGSSSQNPPRESEARGNGSGPPAPPKNSGPSGAGSLTEPDIPKPPRPAAPGLLREVLPELTGGHHHFPNGVKWALSAEGISIDGAPAMGTPGEPSTVRGIWERYGELCSKFASKHGVPVELIVSTIATESGGKPNARRAEPKIGDESVGLMQTLVKTARGALGRATLQGHDLLEPSISIDAGTAYIAQQRGSTHFDPPLVAAAYNAGSIRRDDSEANRWKLVCFPRGTGRHVDNFIAWFSDCMKVSGADDWSSNNSVPSFAGELSGGSPHVSVSKPSEPILMHDVRRFSPDFPPRPSFPALGSADREKVFGKFDFVPDHTKELGDGIKVLHDWKEKNIKKISIPVKEAFGKPGPFEVEFHKLAEQQLIALWLEWERKGLLSKVISWGGAYVPRFQRRSTTKLSNHAFGSAFDINASFNGLGERPVLVGERGSVRELVTIANKYGFYWGGHFQNRLDGMHFEVAKLLTDMELQSLVS